MSLFLTSSLPAANLGNKSRGIPELRLHHLVIIATWSVMVLKKIYLGKEVISRYSLDGSQDFLFGRMHVCEEVIAFYTLVSFILNTLMKPQS